MAKYREKATFMSSLLARTKRRKLRHRNLGRFDENSDVHGAAQFTTVNNSRGLIKQNVPQHIERTASSIGVPLSQRANSLSLSCEFRDSRSPGVMGNGPRTPSLPGLRALAFVVELLVLATLVAGVGASGSSDGLNYTAQGYNPSNQVPSDRFFAPFFAGPRVEFEVGDRAWVFRVRFWVPEGGGIGWCSSSSPFLLPLKTAHNIFCLYS
eukprot:155815-Amorphochlora_amoeboformis.AAC.1